MEKYKAKMYIIGANEYEEVQCWLNDINLHRSFLSVMKKDSMKAGEKLELTHAQLQDVACDYVRCECPKDWQLVEIAKATAKKADFIYELVETPLEG